MVLAVTVPLSSVATIPEMKGRAHPARSTRPHWAARWTTWCAWRVYVTQLDQASLREIHEVRQTYFTGGRCPASTLVRVDQLIREGAVIEIDADAVVESKEVSTVSSEPPPAPRGAAGARTS